MKERLFGLFTILVLIPATVLPQSFRDTDGKIKVAVVKTSHSGLPSVWHGHDFGLELSEGPEILEREGLLELLGNLGCSTETQSVELSTEERQEFGVWHRLGIANSQLGRIVAANIKDGRFTIGLQANDPSALGMLAGLQHSGPARRPLRVGVLWFDAHADFNTPETTLSGMLGGMPVAIASGLCLSRLRVSSGLDPALPTRYIVLAGAQDIDPLEQELLDRSHVEMISVDDIKNLSDAVHSQMKRLSGLTDIIYVHVDLVDIVDNKERPGLELPFPEGPTSEQVAKALEVIFRYEKTAALGVASYPAGDDEDRMFLRAAYNIVEGAIRGIKGRD